LYAMLGQLYGSQNKLDAARANFEQLAAKKPNSVAAHTILGVLGEAMGNRAEARKQYEEVMKIDSSAPVAANNLANIYADEGGNLDVALQLAQAAKRRLPDNPAITDTVGWIYYKKGLPGLAIPLFEDALAKTPDSPTFRYHLGLALLKTGDKAKARAALEMVLKNSPQAPEAAEARKALASM
jgi:tetratricopeptide (TPR) repeat protein